MEDDDIAPPKDLTSLFLEANKENELVANLGDLYVNLLRCSRSPGDSYRRDAAQNLIELMATAALRPKMPMSEVIEKASRRVGWPETPDDAYHKSLNSIAEAAITYLIEASGYNHTRLLTKRTEEFVSKIDDFIERRKRSTLST